jgi:succinylarginine dihydrolase
MQAHEWQFDGLVGPTHNYAGLAVGNTASARNAGAVANPKKAALQGLDKMAFVRGLGMKQAFLPPQPRPVLAALRQVGFGGNAPKMLEDAHRDAPELLASVFSSAFMWAANAATILPSADTADGRVHIRPANLLSNFHRALEPTYMTQILRQIFSDATHFAVHDPLPATPRFADEGAANHMRICTHHGGRGLHMFVYGMSGSTPLPTRVYPARQHLEACQRILAPLAMPPIYAQQHPDAIDAGVFHHDVIAMNTTRLMISHEMAFADRASVIAALQKATEGVDFTHIEISNDDVPLKDAVKSYFFNAQLLELPSGSYVIVAPSECEETPYAHATLQRLQDGNGPISAVHYRDVRESMRNGGGPACLRLRVVLSDAEAAAMHQKVIFDPSREDALRAWVNTHYRDRLALNDLRDPAFVTELDDAYNALYQMLEIRID